MFVRDPIMLGPYWVLSDKPQIAGFLLQAHPQKNLQFIETAIYNPQDHTNSKPASNQPQPPLRIPSSLLKDPGDSSSHRSLGKGSHVYPIRLNEPQ